MFADSGHPASQQDCLLNILSNVSVQVNTKLKVKNLQDTKYVPLEVDTSKLWLW
jgi:hypothetical protein